MPPSVKGTETLETMTNLQQLENYIVEVLKTAQTEAFSPEYLVPGIVGEVGEMFGHKAKAFWHGKPQEELNKELTLELGDVAWMTALLLHTHGDLGVPEVDRFTNPSPDLNAWRELLSLVESLYYHYTRGNRDAVYRDATALWALVANHSPALVGNGFQVVMDRNIQKLADRAARNVLRGSGDHR